MTKPSGCKGGRTWFQLRLLLTYYIHFNLQSLRGAVVGPASNQIGEKTPPCLCTLATYLHNCRCVEDVAWNLGCKSINISL
ncbi:hypothetical protein GCK32_012517 [Trichostrongylus colubriformis]|uniref:Uncharacterized protein n=1 Tax=Trichostrongylus colubriformis TaxID=6319 RepID=A0AAN8F419_TRICO